MKESHFCNKRLRLFNHIFLYLQAGKKYLDVLYLEYLIANDKMPNDYLFGRRVLIEES